ncbi:MAG: hypothetical protein NT126_05150 [Bacteroidetes bacterium]|nr:hypothetical protein [Bacteroidota bacterium]
MSIVFTCCLLYNYFIRYRHFKILETSPLQILAGAKHAQDFLSCRIKLMAKFPGHKLVFDELWIDDRLYKVRITDEENRHVENIFRKKQILYIDAGSEINHHTFAPPKTKSGSKIFLGYRVDDKRKYFPIDLFVEEAGQAAVA